MNVNSKGIWVSVCALVVNAAAQAAPAEHVIGLDLVSLVGEDGMVEFRPRLLIAFLR